MLTLLYTGIPIFHKGLRAVAKKSAFRYNEVMVEIAGGIVWNPNHGVAVVNQHHDSWSLPKGHVEAGEDHLAAAMREIEEETGIPRTELTLMTLVGSYTRHKIKKHDQDIPEERTITLYFFMTTFETLAPQDPDNPEAKWVTPEEVPGFLTHERDQEFFRDFLKHHPLPLHQS